MSDPIDLLQIKIDQAKAKLPKATINAINAVDWKPVILGLREKKGYTFEQLGDLEIETELLLSGLVSPEQYPKELQNRMKLGGPQVNELVNEMNDLVFSRIRAELIKNTQRKETPERRAPMETVPVTTPTLAELQSHEAKVLNIHGIEILDGKSKLPAVEKLELPAQPNAQAKSTIVSTPAKATPQEGNKIPAHSILAQKLGGAVQTPVKETDHALRNLSSTSATSDKPKVDPYREIPE